MRRLFLLATGALVLLLSTTYAATVSADPPFLSYLSGTYDCDPTPSRGHAVFEYDGRTDSVTMTTWSRSGNRLVNRYPEANAQMWGGQPNTMLLNPTGYVDTQMFIVFDMEGRRPVNIAGFRIQGDRTYSEQYACHKVQ